MRRPPAAEPDLALRSRLSVVSCSHLLGLTTQDGQDTSLGNKGAPWILAV